MSRDHTFKPYHRFRVYAEATSLLLLLGRLQDQFVFDNETRNWYQPIYRQEPDNEQCCFTSITRQKSTFGNSPTEEGLMLERR